MTEGWLFKCSIQITINLGTNEFMDLSQVQRLNRMREMSPRQVRYCFIDDLYIRAQLDTNCKSDIIELVFVIYLSVTYLCCVT